MAIPPRTNSDPNARTLPVANSGTCAKADEVNLLAILLFAMLCAFVGGLARNHVAWPLLASAVLCLTLDHYGVPFNPVLWTVIDLAVIAAIVRIRKGRMTRLDWIILALFVPGWVAYALPEGPRFAGGFAVVVTQMVLTLPFAKIRERARDATRTGRTPHDPFDDICIAACA